MVQNLTENSLLKKQINKMEMESTFTTRFKYVEEAGQSLGNILGTLDPWKTPCNRGNCFPCQKEPGKCMKPGVCYIITCNTCKELGKEVKYHGESSKCGYDRGLEHLMALSNTNEDSPLVEHQLEQHPNVPHNFTMEIESFHSTPLSRQTQEASLIEEFSGDQILNRRGEWGQNLPPKLAIDDDKVKPESQTKRKVPTKVVKVQTHGQETDSHTDLTPPPAKRLRQKIADRDIPIQVKPRSHSLTVKQLIDRMAENTKVP